MIPDDGPRLVLDANVVIAWFFQENEPERAYSASVLDYIRSESPWLIVPSFFHNEIGSFLSKRRRHKPAKFGASRLAETLDLLDALSFNTRLTTHTYRKIVALADRYHIQAKDVPYFDLARVLGVPIAAIDGGIKTACRAHGVELLAFS